MGTYRLPKIKVGKPKRNYSIEPQFTSSLFQALEVAFAGRDVIMLAKPNIDYRLRFLKGIGNSRKQYQCGAVRYRHML